MRVASAPVRLNWAMAELMSSAASATSMPSDAARSSAPFRPPERMSDVLMPALPSSLIASAASVAEYTVSAPASMAAWRSRDISSALAPVLAWTVDMPASKSAAMRTAATPNAVAAMPAAAMPAVRSFVLPPDASMVVEVFSASADTLAMPAVNFDVSASRRTVMLRFSPPAMVVSLSCLDGGGQ